MIFLNKREQSRFLKRIVWFCISFIVAVVVACYVAAWFQVEADIVLTCTCTVFGGELLLSAVIKLGGVERDVQQPKKVNTPEKKPPLG